MPFTRQGRRSTSRLRGTVRARLRAPDFASLFLLHFFIIFSLSPFSLLMRTYVPNDVSNASNSLFVIHTFPNIIMKYMFYVTTLTLTVSERRKKKKNLLLSRRVTYNERKRVTTLPRYNEMSRFLRFPSQIKSL